MHAVEEVLMSERAAKENEEIK